MKNSWSVRVGPAQFRIGSAWDAPLRQLRDLYRDYPAADGVPDFSVRLEPTQPWRRWLRPSVRIAGDFTLPEAAPLPLGQALLAAEMAMNLQMALGWRRHLLLHAAVVERDGQALVITGESGAGKSTLAALLMRAGWRFMGDEFALLGLRDGLFHPFPRPLSLKNASVPLLTGAGAWGPELVGTPKGTIRHLAPDPVALDAMDVPAAPRAILFPRYGASGAVRDMSPSEAFVRLTTASTNYAGLGEAGFTALTRLVKSVPALALDYPDSRTALAMVDELW